jgi:hypothetical protein
MRPRWCVWGGVVGWVSLSAGAHVSPHEWGRIIVQPNAHLGVNFDSKNYFPRDITNSTQPLILNRAVDRSHRRGASHAYTTVPSNDRKKKNSLPLPKKKKEKENSNKCEEMHSWTHRLLAAATTAVVLLAAVCAAASALDAFHAPDVQAQAHVPIHSSPRLLYSSVPGAICDPYLPLGRV